MGPSPRAIGRAARSGFTLLELVVALTISMMLLSALYWAMNAILGNQRSGRNLAENSAAVRSILGRMEKDILAQLAPLDPTINPTAVQMTSGGTAGSGSSSASGSGTSTSASGGTSASGTSGSSTASSGSSSTSSSSSSAASTTSIVSGTGVGNNGPVVFNLGVQAPDAQHLTLFVSQFPSEAFRPPANGQGPPVVSDLRRVTYWLAGGSGAALGLARQELKVATSQDALTPFDETQLDEKSYVIGPEVVDLQFEFYDPASSSWVASWDGTALQSDGKTPMGPPPAIAINLTVRRPNATSADQNVTYRHVVAIPTANNFVTNADGSTGTSSMTTASSGTSSGTSMQGSTGP